MSKYTDLDNIEIKKLKSKISELEIQLSKANEILKENDLLEDIKQVSDAEAICVSEIQKLKLETIPFLNKR